VVLELCVDLDGRAEDVAVARRFVAATLEEWDLHDRVDDARLIASELVGNAVLHARTGIRVTVRVQAVDVVRIEVYDQNSRMPVLVAPPDDATSGRGLSVVAKLATTWGTRSHGDGKTVWAQLGHTVVDEPDCIDLTDARPHR
jgi:anti-sigma regulatory factor (Ser/Thr protein kinase)